MRIVKNCIRTGDIHTTSTFKSPITYLISLISSSIKQSFNQFLSPSRIQVKIKKTVKFSLCALPLLLLSACGSSDGPDEKEQDPPTTQEPGNNPGDTQDPNDGDDTTTPNPSTPIVIADNNPLPPAKITSVLAMTTLAVSSITATIETNGDLTVAWENSNADSFRVLLWTAAGETHQIATQENTVSFINNIATAGDQVLIESYDHLGNSLFSSPTTVEAL